MITSLYQGLLSDPASITTKNDGDWVINSNNDIYSGVSGSVGIGTIAPAAKLDVRGIGKKIINIESPVTSDEAGIKFSRTDNGDFAHIYLENYGHPHSATNMNRLVLESGDDGDQDYIVLRNLHYSGVAKDVMAVHRDKITMDASVGIGTIVPLAKFHVVSSTNIGAAIAMSSGSTNINNQTALTIMNSDPTNGNYASLWFGHKSNPGNASAVIGAKFTDHTNGYAHLDFATFGAGGNGIRMRITDNGNVGIGTVTATEKLEVSGNIKSSSLAGGTGNSMVISDATGKLGILPLNGSGSPVWNTTGNSGTNVSSNFIGTADAQDLVIKTTGTERMRITSAGTHPGLVGIGTNNPEKALHIKTVHEIFLEPVITCQSPFPPPGCIPVVGASSHNGMRLEDIIEYKVGTSVISASSTKWDLLPAFGSFIIGKADISSADYNDFIGTQPMVMVNPYGNVGIGGDPREKLQIGNTFTFHDGGNKVIARNFYFDALDKRIEQGKVAAIYFGDGALGFKVAPDGAADDQINWVNALDIINNGNVGIGTTNPGAALEVKPSAIDNNVIAMKLTSADAILAPDQELQLDFTQLGVTGARVAMTYFDTDYGLNFYGWNGVFNATPIVTMRGNGNVGIGTIDPQAKLQVNAANDGDIAFAVYKDDGTEQFRIMGNGKFYGKGYKITLDGFPDYVFGKNYKRMSADEKAKYIEENQHLPYLPSAKEIEKDGLDVGDGLIGITKNVEENSLDINDLFERMKRLEIVNKEKDEKIKKLEDEIKSIKK